MARFQDLSAELVLGILGEVLPEDVESIALASKSVYQLAVPRLEEHRRLRKQYTNFRNTVEYKPNHWHDPGGLLADLLCKVVSDARTGLYVKKLKLHFLNYGPGSSKISHPPHDQEYEPAFDCLDVIHPLVVLASHTLEHLELGSLDIEIGQIPSMRGFRALREIEFETSRCLIVDESKIAGFVGALPITIERIAMRWDEPNCVDGFGELTEAFLSFIRESKTQLPHLRTLHVTSRDEEEYDALWDLFTTNATAQLNTRLSFDLQGPNGGGEIPAWADNVCTCGQDCFGNDSD